MEFDTHELAWAAGFMDGEGYFGAGVHKRAKDKRSYPSLRIQASQIDDKVLIRLQKTLQMGHVRGPFAKPDLSGNGKTKPAYEYHLDNFEQCQAVIALLWKYLSPVKRAQAKKAMLTMLAYFPTRERVQNTGKKTFLKTNEP